MNSVKKFLGIVWMITGPAAIFFLLLAAIENINGSQKGDISNPIPWIIIITIFTPIAAGLCVFGWYSWKGVYDEEVESLNH